MCKQLQMQMLNFGLVAHTIADLLRIKKKNCDLGKNNDLFTVPADVNTE